MYRAARRRLRRRRNGKHRIFGRRRL